MNGRQPGAGLYFPLWALVLPISSLLVIPGIQGTTPAYLFALALLLPWVSLSVMSEDDGKAFYRGVLSLALAFIAINAVAQLGLALSGLRDFGPAEMVDPLDRSIVLRATLFTQSIYLFAGFATFLFVRLRYTPAWDRWFLLGAVLLGAYGVYEVIYFSLFGASGDFLSNRTFGGGQVSGSFFQVISLGPISLQRLKSLTGEPSMYAFTVLPFWIYALHNGYTKTHWFLAATLLLSTATTAFVGIALYALLRLAFLRGRDKGMLFILVAVIALGVHDHFVPL